MLVPLLSVAKAARPGFHDADPGTREVWRAIDAAPTPAAVVSTGGRADVATEVWRAGWSSAQQSLVLLPLAPEVLATYFPNRPVHAWAGHGEALASRGFLAAPGVDSGGHAAPLAPD